MLDAAILLAFVGYSVATGLASRRTASRGLDEYLLAGRTVSGWRAGTSMAATQFAADTPLLVAGLVATAGIAGLWRLWIYGLAFLLLAYVFASGWRRAGILTDAELVERRYSGRGLLALRAFKALYYGTLFNCAVLAMVLVAALVIAERLLPWHQMLPTSLYLPLRDLLGGIGQGFTSAAPVIALDTAATNNVLSIAAIVGFTTLYSMTGGLRAVVRTDVVQFALAMAGTIAFAWVLVAQAGGLGGLTDRLVEMYGHAHATRLLAFAPAASDAAWAFITVIALQWVLQINSDGTGYLAQRAMACPTDRDARIAGVLFAFLQILLRSLPWLLIGCALLILYPIAPGATDAPGFTAQREIAFVAAIDEWMPAGLRGLMMVALLAALASTLDTHLNWGAAYWCNDLYRRIVCHAWWRRDPGGRELVFVARLSNLLIVALALFVMTHLDSIQQAWELTLLFGAGAGPVLMLRWLWERINLSAEIAALITSIVVAPAWLWLSPGLDWVQADPMRAQALGLALVGGCSAIASIAGALLGPRTDAAVLVDFYRRVRPMGFWSATAIAAGEHPGDAPRRLGNALLSTALTSASLFLCLYGSARLLLPMPQGSPLWPSLALAAGVAIAPLWITRLRK